ncbi:MAG: hypothetical protein J5737_00210 [Bacteroidales bacterium]|nr:hypothetical protein [Bacteroidales bacterium]
MTTIMQLSALYEEECWFPDGAGIVDLRSVEGTNCYCTPAAASSVRKAIEGITPPGIHWIDTGDYHYLSLFWMELLKEPFALALYDNHPDDQDGAFDSGILSCGNWVQEARRSLPLMRADCQNSPVLPEGLPVYLSVDMDVMPRQYARTDWDQGEMALSHLMSDIGRIAAGHRILGVDICGGLTAGKGASAEDYRVNTGTREILQNFLSGLL